MSTHFYIVDEVGNKSGPHDLVYMVKKIRSGTIVKTTMVTMEKSAPPQPAEAFEELLDFLEEQSVEVPSLQEVQIKKVRTLNHWLKSGWGFLQENQLSTMYSGLYVVYLLLSSAMVAVVFPPAMEMLGYMGCFIIGQYFFTGYLYSVLRMVRSQPVDMSFIRLKMSPIKKQLLITSVMMSFFIIIGILLMIAGGTAAIVGLLIVALPGFYKISLFIFAPLLILDKGMNYWDALDTSRKTVNKSGLENTGIIFALLIINFVAGLCFLVPMIVTLPITIAAICEMYDEIFV